MTKWNDPEEDADDAAGFGLDARFESEVDYIDQLEQRILEILSSLETLHEEKKNLKRQVSEMQGKLQEKDAELARLRANEERATASVSKSRKFKEKEEVIRSRVQKMMAKLEHLEEIIYN